MLRGANDPQTHVRQYLQRPYLEEYLRQGYVFERGIPGQGAASVTLEYQNADFAISRLAGALGDQENAHRFLERSARWRALFDSETRYIRPRGLDGAFLPGFTPAKEAGFVEGNSAQYTWMVPYDLPGVIDAVGGPSAALSRLDQYFSQPYIWDAQKGPFFGSATNHASAIPGSIIGRAIHGERRKSCARRCGSSSTRVSGTARQRRSGCHVLMGGFRATGPLPGDPGGGRADAAQPGISGSHFTARESLLAHRRCGRSRQTLRPESESRWTTGAELVDRMGASGACIQARF